MPALSRLVRIVLTLALTLATWLAGCRRVEQPWSAPDHAPPFDIPPDDDQDQIPFDGAIPDRVAPRQAPVTLITQR